MPPTTLARLKKHLRPGGVYRRTNLLRWSNSIDRHLKNLIADGTLQKLRRGLYYRPRKFEFGEAPADEETLLNAFLGTNHFVLVSPNAYNQLGVGTTQLYDKRVVCNQQRNGTLMPDKPQQHRTNRVFKSLHKPLTYLGVERTLFYFVCVSAVDAFNLFNSILAGIAVFIGGFAFGHWVTNSDPAFLRILAKSERYKLRYDAAKQQVPRVEVV